MTTRISPWGPRWAGKRRNLLLSRLAPRWAGKKFPHFKRRAVKAGIKGKGSRVSDEAQTEKSDTPASAGQGAAAP